MTHVIDDPYIREFANQRVDNQSAAVYQVESSRLLPWLMVCCLISGCAIAAAVWSITYAQRAEREARMLQYYVMELDGKLMAANVIPANQSFSAKQGSTK